MGVLQERLGGLGGGDEEVTVGEQEPVDGLEAVPGPGLDALAQGVVHADGNVELLGLVAGHVLLELFLGVRHDGEVLGGDPVSLGAVSVAAEGDPPLASLAGREDDAPGDAGRQVLLEDAPIDDLTDQVGHAILRSRGSFGQVV